VRVRLSSCVLTYTVTRLVWSVMALSKKNSSPKKGLAVPNLVLVTTRWPLSITTTQYGLSALLSRCGARPSAGRAPVPGPRQPMPPACRHHGTHLP
jgi:hypothetical protein